jgi:hypothetical protein
MSSIARWPVCMPHAPRHAPGRRACWRRTSRAASSTRTFAARSPPRACACRHGRIAWTVDEARQIAARVADLDDVVPIVLGAMVLAYVGPTDTSLWWKLGSTIGLGLAIAVCGWLLLERAKGAAERGVFVLGVLALLGGAPAYLQLSPLLAGLAAGWFWVAAPGGCDRLVTTELRKVQHPLIVLLLITAGAWLGPNLIGVWLFVPFVVFRLAGKLLGGWAASRIAGGATPTSLGAYLVPPGVIGIAFALNLHQVATDGAAALVFAVTVGSVASEAIALVVTPPPHQT